MKHTIKIISAENMKASEPLIQAEIREGEQRGEKLTRIIHDLPQKEGEAVQTILFFEPAKEG